MPVLSAAPYIHCGCSLSYNYPLILASSVCGSICFLRLFFYIQTWSINYLLFQRLSVFFTTAIFLITLLYYLPDVLLPWYVLYRYSLSWYVLYRYSLSLLYHALIPKNNQFYKYWCKYVKIYSLKIADLALSNNHSLNNSLNS